MMMMTSGLKNIVSVYSTPSFRKGVESFLKNEGLNIYYKTFEAVEEQEWRKFEADVVLAEFQEKFREVYHYLIRDLEIPLILIIREGEEEHVQELLELGAYDYLYLDRPKKLAFILKNFDREQQLLIAREKERTYQAIFENSLDGILLTVPDGRILAANPAACRIFQMTEEELRSTGRSGVVITHHSSLNAALEARERTGKVKAEIMMRRKDGSIFPAEVTSSVFKTANGEKRSSLIIRDISEFKRAQEQLQSSRESYEYLFKNNPLPNVIYDVDSYEILEANQAAVNYYNYSYEDFLKLTVLDFLPEEEIGRLKNFLENHKQNAGEVVQHQMLHLKKDASPVPVETFGYSLKYENRNCRLVTCLDVSQREMYLDQIRQKSLQLEAAQQIAKIGYWIHDLNKEQLYWSDEVFRIWEMEKENFDGSLQTFIETIHPDDLQKFQEANSKALEGEKDLDLEHRIITAEGKVKWVHERGKLNMTGSEKGVFEGTVQDITERKETLEKLIQVESRQRAILKSQTNYLIRTDMDGKYSYCNDKFRCDFQWIFSDGEIIGKDAYQSVQAYHHQRVEDVFNKCLLEPNMVFQVEIDKLQKDGGSKSTLWDFICLTDSLGQPIEIQCVGIDITDRVKIEKSLQESNNRNELVLRATSDAIYDWNCATGDIFWSEGYYNLFGYDPGLKPLNINEWVQNVHPDDSEVVEQVFNVIAGKEEIFQAEYRYKKANGEYAHVVEKGTIVRDENGKSIRMVGALQDITEAKITLLKLMKSEARHKGLIQSQTNYIVRIDLEGKYTYANQKFSDDFGWVYPGKNIIGENSMDSVMAYHYPRIKEVAEKCLTNPDRVFQIEIDKPARNGGVKTTLWDMIFLKGTGDENDEMQCVGIDISDRVKAEAENYFQANLLNKIGQAVIATDVNGKIVYWNNAATDMYGWKIEEAVGDKIDYLFPQLVHGSLPAECHGKEVKIWSGEFKVQKKSGNEIDIFLTNSPVYNEYGVLTGFIGVSSDITERIKADNELKELNRDLKKYTEELIAANKGLEQFSYIISHNLRAPVANIIGLGNLLDEDYPEEVKKKFKAEMLNNVKRLDTIIKDLNDILQVKVETSEKKELVDLNDLVDSIKEGIGQVIQKEKVEIITDFQEVPVLHSIKTYLHSVFYNLIFNSVKYRQIQREPVLKIKSRQKEGKVIINFEDNGVGIDLEKRGNEIFGLYKRFHHHVEGKGMGLFMVKTQVELMGGKIKVSSEVDEGTIFTIEFEQDKYLGGLKNEEAERVHCS
jgi:PAS domain S-box-containing protein